MTTPKDLPRRFIKAVRSGLLPGWKVVKPKRSKGKVA